MGGLLITFEGIGGSGKSTVARLTAERLEAQGIAVELTREPGGTELGHELREVLISGRLVPTPWAEAFLFEADRAQLYAEVILPALETGKVVLSDRGPYGTLAYQGAARGLDQQIIERMNAMATAGRRPDVVFVIDIDPTVGLTRNAASGEHDRFDAEKMAFQAAARRGYLEAARADGSRAHVIDGERSLERVLTEVRQVLAQHLTIHE